MTTKTRKEKNETLDPGAEAVLSTCVLQTVAFASYPFGDGFVVRQPETNACLTLTVGQHELIERMRRPVTIEELLRDESQRNASCAYTELTALLVRLLRGGFFTDAAAAQLQRQPVFAGIAVQKPLSLSLPLPALPALPLPRTVRGWTWLLLATIPVAAGIAVWLIIAGSMIDPARLAGSHLAALLFWLVALAILYSLRSLAKAALLRAAGAPLPPPTLRVRFALPYIAVDDRGIVCAGREFTVRYHGLVILLPVWLAAPALLFWAWSPGPAPVLWAEACVAGVFFSLCPLVNSHLARLFRHETGDEGFTDDLRAFMARRFLARLLTGGPGFAGEKRYLVLALLGVVWLYAAYRAVGGLLEGSGGELLDTLILGDAAGERLVAFLLLAGMVFPLVLSALALLRLGLLNLAGVMEKPLDRLRQLAGGWRRPVMPTAEEMVECLAAVPLFTGLSRDARQSAAAAMRAVAYPKRARIVWQGEPGDAFYLIYRGLAEVVFEEPTGARRQLARLADGDAFGEIALLRDAPRTASVVAVQRTVCLVLPRSAFVELVAQLGAAGQKLTEQIQLAAFLKPLPLFARVPAEVLHRLAAAARTMRWEKDAPICREGEAGDLFHVVRTGTVAVWREHGTPAATRLAMLGQGQFFGELALLGDGRRTATVIAGEECSTVAVPRSAFLIFLNNHLGAGVRLEAAAAQRRQILRGRSPRA